MTTRVKNNAGWGILTVILWGFFVLIIDVPEQYGFGVLLTLAFLYAFAISSLLAFLQWQAFPKLNSFSEKRQFILKSFFIAIGALIGYLLMFLVQTLIFTSRENLIGSFSLGFFQSLVAIVTTPFSSESFIETIPKDALSALGTFSILLAMIAIISTVLAYVDTHWKRINSEKKIQEARLKLLEMQMQPHFLFNTLNTILAVIRSDPNKAEALLLHLSDFLRFNFNSANHELVPLVEELQFTENYLKLMQARFASKLDWKVKLEARCEKIKVPVMLIQPLVENALKYSLSENQEKLNIRIQCSSLKGQCIIEVKDDGPGINLENYKTFPPSGHSLDNISQRLWLYYSKPDLLKVDSGPGNGTQITVKIPG